MRWEVARGGFGSAAFNEGTGGEAPHPAQAPRWFPNGGAPGRAQLSSLQLQKQTEHPKSDFHGVTFAGSAAPGARQAPGAPQAVPRRGRQPRERRCQLRSQPWDIQGHQNPSGALALDAALLKGTSSAVSYLSSASVPRLRQRGVLLQLHSSPHSTRSGTECLESTHTRKVFRSNLQCVRPQLMQPDSTQAQHSGVPLTCHPSHGQPAEAVWQETGSEKAAGLLFFYFFPFLFS